MLKEEEKFGIKNFKTYKKFGEKVYQIRKCETKYKKLKDNNNLIIGYGAPAKPQLVKFFWYFKGKSIL